ncbi:matrix metalloproteinase-14-like isoform X2 [Anneissia japonica]|uniref:matrix metalloproteinase-14-like isoform X2 n=1 Tax=Anneissia japonica TaxID=1529436 RepID=UPI001425587C|nr:matrix metalloproteinase-14-like isoform X2 [Anneissia japonica]
MSYTYASCLFVLLALAGTINAAPLTNQIQQAEHYLQVCGYLAKVAEEDQHFNDDAIKQALLNFQEYAGLDPAKGILTEETLKQMEESPCRDAETNRKRRSIPVIHGWDSHVVTWDITSYSKWLSKSEVDKTAEEALKMWSDAADITFVRVPGGEVDISIAFLTGAHGDIDFGGINKALAHTYYPPKSGSGGVLEGDVHLDDARQWTVKSSTAGHDLRVTLLHELGHSIGIAHSTNRNDAMFSSESTSTLSENDKAAARKLYGAPKGEPAYVSPKPATQVPVVVTPKTTTSSQPKGESDDSNCPTSIDAATQMLTGEIILIKGDKLWKIVDNQLVPGHPVQVSTVFSGLPANIDSAMTMPEHMVDWGNKAGKTYFFKADNNGTQVWRYSGYSPEVGYPKSLELEFGVSLPHVDAAYTIGGLRGVYFIGGTNYYLETPYQQIGPFQTDSFQGFNSQATAALSGADDITYILFGADGNYYEINPLGLPELDIAPWSVLPGFPRSTSLGWFGCNI